MLPVYGANYTHRPPERPRTTGQPNNAPRQLEFGEAMNDFKHMFPTLDRDVIEAVLRANNGLVDATIDQLLSMGVDMQESVSSSLDSEHHPLPSYSDLNESEPPPAYTPRESNSSRSSTASRPLPAKPYSAWNPPLLGKLPDDFLRLGPSTTPVRSPLAGSGDSMNDRELERFLEDEKLAMVLQNQEFMRELRHNKDFMLSLEKGLWFRIINQRILLHPNLLTYGILDQKHGYYHLGFAVKKIYDSFFGKELLHFSLFGTFYFNTVIQN